MAISIGFIIFYSTWANQMETLGQSNNFSELRLLLLLLPLLLLLFSSQHENNLPIGFIQILYNKLLETHHSFTSVLLTTCLSIENFEAYHCWPPIIQTSKSNHWELDIIIIIIIDQGPLLKNQLCVSLPSIVVNGNISFAFTYFYYTYHFIGLYLAPGDVVLKAITIERRQQITNNVLPSEVFFPPFDRPYSMIRSIYCQSIKDGNGGGIGNL